MLQAPELSGELQITAEHGEALIALRLTHGKGRITLRVEPDYAADGHAELILSTDQTQAASALRDVRALLAEYPDLAALGRGDDG